MQNYAKSMQYFFEPNSITVIGVSRDAEAVGSTIYTNLVSDAFVGTVYPVNPFISEFQGKQCYPSVLSINDSIDLAIIVVPSTLVASVLLEVGKKGIPAAIIISSGFSETGPQGVKRELEIQAIAEDFSIALMGPNCLGMIHPHNNVNASFARTKPIKGSIAFLSQSGALGTALLDIITPYGIGISHFISLGNKAGITEADCLEYLSKDETTNVIGMYVEELTDANRLIQIGRSMLSHTHPKPIVVLKGGRTKAGTDAVQSHTGSLAGQPEAYTALFQQAGIIETHSTQEFINTLICFAQNPLPKHNTCAIVTNAGGPGILSTDTLTEHHITLPQLSGMHNPIDLLGDAKAKDFETVLQTLEQDASVGSILAIVTPQTVTEIPDTANVFCMHKTKSTKPLAVCWMGNGVMKEGNQILAMGNIPVSKYPEQAALMLSKLHEYSELKKRRALAPDISTDIPKHTMPLTVSDPLAIVRTIHIPVPSYFVLPDIQSFPTVYQSLSDTIVIKILSKQLIHKSDSGAVRLHVQKLHAMSEAKEMMQQIKTQLPDAHIDGILLMDMVDTTKGMEYIIGLKNIGKLGMMLMLGIGGIFVEILHDVAFRFVPITRPEAMDLVQSLHSYPLLQGARNTPPLDVEALCTALMSVSQLAIDHPEIEELDINPLLVLPVGVIALDARIKIRPL